MALSEMNQRANRLDYCITEIQRDSLSRKGGNRVGGLKRGTKPPGSRLNQGK